MKNKNHNKLISKDNRLIKFKGRMTLNELKLFNLIVAEVREQQRNQFEKYKIDVSTLANRTEFKDFYNYILEIALNLEKKRILLDGRDERGEYKTTLRLINKPIVRKDSKEVELYIDKDLVPYILELKKYFTSYEITNILNLNSSYSIRLYEILKSYEYKGIYTVELLELREYLGIKEEEYYRFYDFEKWVLKVAKLEINKETDIVIDYEKIKSGRKISKIMFKIDPKDMEKELYIEYLDKNYRIKDIKQMAGLSQENFNSEQIIELYGIAVKKLEDHEEKDILEYIRLNYLYVKDKAGNGKYSYLKKALKEDYAVAEGQIKFDYYIK